MFVYIDGLYQCNRSKHMPSPDSPGGGRIEMKLRQKEEKVAGGEGNFVGREWRWVDLGVGMLSSLACPKLVSDYANTTEYDRASE